MVASESVTLEGTGHEFDRHVAPGEAVFIDLQGKVHAQQCADNPKLYPCIFEYVYLARPDSVLDGISVYQARLNLGETLAKRVVSTVPPNEIDVDHPDPRIEPPERDAAGAPAGHSVPRRLRQEPLRRPHLHHAGAGRAQEVGAPEAQRDRQRVQGPQRAAGGRLHRARHHQPRDRADGARRRRQKVYLASAAPPVRYPNVYGIDMPTSSELVAHGRTIEEIREIIGCDALIYQDVEGMKRAIGSLNPKLDGFDASCFDGVYVTGDINADDIARINEARIGQEDPLDEDTSRLALPNAQEA